MSASPNEIRPQGGPQTRFLQSVADIALYGGAAGGGKTFALLLDPLYQYENPNFSGVIFRRNAVQIRNPGGLWDESTKLYTTLRGQPKQAFLEWHFATGFRMKFAHLEHEWSIYDWQGSQLSWLGFDELVHFTEKQFWYMLSRLRSMAGVPARMRATCNPDVDSWVRPLIDWWIGPDGLAIPERSGVLRYFIRVDDRIIWADSREELTDRYGHDIPPLSFTFISARLSDNQILMRSNPQYRANLLAMSRVDRLRLEGGNWNVRASAGMLFRREWFRVVDAIPAGWVSAIRFWDRAATPPSESNQNPDWTRGLLLYRYADGRYIVANLRSMQDTPGQVEELIKNTAAFDTHAVQVMSQQDPGSAGKAEAEYFTRMLAGVPVKTDTMPKDKVTRAKPVSAQCEAGNIWILRAPWNEEFFQELESFPEGAHDDIVDTLSGAFNELCGATSTADVI